MKVVSIIGRSGSGKTTLIERLIPELMKSGLSVATIKHDAHNFEVDKVGKDSWRHKNAGAKMTIVSSAKKIALFADSNGDSSLESLCERFINGVDVVLTEGYRMSKYPKLEVTRVENGELICGAANNLKAIVSDYQFDRGVPVLKPDNISEIAEFIVKLPDLDEPDK